MDIPDIDLAWLWFAAGLFFALAEIFLPSFFMLFAAVATLAPIGAALLGFELTTQLIAFGLALLIAIFGLRPAFLKKFKVTQSIPSRADRLMGKTGTVSQTINPDGAPGRIDIMGEDWAALSREFIEAGHPAKVIGIDGGVLWVQTPVDESLQKQKKPTV